MDLMEISKKRKKEREEAGQLLHKLDDSQARYNHCHRDIEDLLAERGITVARTPTYYSSRG